MAAIPQPLAEAKDFRMSEIMRRILAHAIGKEFRNEEYPFERDVAHIHREVSEAFEAYRRCPEDKDWKAIVEVDGKPEGVTVEMADALMRIIEFCAYHRLALNEVIKRKLTYLEAADLPPRHGKRF